MSVGLILFLTARYDEAERYARVMAEVGEDVADGAGEDAYAAIAKILIPLMSDSRVKREMASWLDRGVSPPNDLRHVSRVIAAGRARLALLDEAVTEMDRLLADDDAKKIDQGVAIGRKEAALTAVMHDAIVYAGHPDYRDDWRITP